MAFANVARSPHSTISTNDLLNIEPSYKTVLFDPTTRLALHSYHFA